jgi:hypothetical protein
LGELAGGSEKSGTEEIVGGHDGLFREEIMVAICSGVSRTRMKCVSVKLR